MIPAGAHQRSDLEALLSSALGLPQARVVVADALVALRIDSGELDTATARRVLAYISQTDGLIGIAGRVALTRLEGARSPSGTLVAEPRVKRSIELLGRLLAPTLGGERAGTLVSQVARSLGFGTDIDLDQALRLLEHVAQMPGVTGIAARFAKTRIHLSW